MSITWPHIYVTRLCKLGFNYGCTMRWCECECHLAEAGE